MRAYTISFPGEVSCQNVPKPVPAPDEALVRVAYSGLSTQDLAILSGDMTLVRNGSIRYPVRFGHEWSGIVESVGKNVTNLAPGDRVVSDSGVTCGKCDACLRKQWHKCENTYSLGISNCWDGSFAEYMHMPERHLYKLPASVSLMEAALVEPACIALAGVKKADIGPGKTVLVMGTGAIGLAAVALAKYYGADKVLLGGRTEEKLAVGRTMGADGCVNTRKTNVVGLVQKETAGKGVDAVIETSGNVAVIPDILAAAAPGAQISLIGFYEKGVPDFPIDDIVTKSLWVGGVMGEFGTPAEVLEILKTGKLDLKPLITHVIPFGRTADVMTNISQYRDRIKIMVKIAGG